MAKSEESKIFKFQTREGGTYQIGDHGKHLQLTAERLAESAKNQAEWNNSPHLTISSAMAHVHKARREALEWLQAARSTELELHQDHTKQERKEIKARYHHLTTLLAEALAVCGNYKEALMVLPKHRVDLRREFERVLGAIERPDDDMCGPECKQRFDADPTKVTREHVLKYVYSKRHGGMVPVIRCVTCEGLNARSMSRHLAQLEEAATRKDPPSPLEVGRLLRAAGSDLKEGS